MVQAVRIHKTGGPEVMVLEDVELGAPGPGMVTVANRAIGLNYIDTYHRSGLYPLPLPTGIGLEGAGVVQAVGEGVELREGDRVAYCSAGFGAYAQALNLPASRLVKIPDGIDFEQAAACLLKGQTTEYLLQRTYPLQAGETCLFHAAAGGVGLIFGQWAQQHRRHGDWHGGITAKSRAGTGPWLCACHQLPHRKCGATGAGDYRRPEGAGGV